MGLFSKENCIVCGIEVGAMSRTKLNDGNFICTSCMSKTKLSDGWNINTLKSATLTQINGRIKLAEQNEKENNNRISRFTPTLKEGGYIWFDDNNNWFAIPKGTFSAKIDNSFVFKYNEILDFEVLEDGATITKGGFGKAIVGGAIFGLAGAIAGGTSKKSKQVCTKLEIKITTKNIDNPVIYITLLNTEFKKDSFVYKTAYKSVQNILSKFQIIVNQLENNSDIEKNENISVTDEIKKYKELLDMGAISQEEFDEKKKQLLNL